MLIYPYIALVPWRDLYLSSCLIMSDKVESKRDRQEMRGQTALSHCFSSITFPKHVLWRQNMLMSRVFVFQCAKTLCWSYTGCKILQPVSWSNFSQLKKVETYGGVVWHTWKLFTTDFQSISDNCFFLSTHHLYSIILSFSQKGSSELQFNYVNLNYVIGC